MVWLPTYGGKFYWRKDMHYAKKKKKIYTPHLLWMWIYYLNMEGNFMRLIYWYLVWMGFNWRNSADMWQTRKWWAERNVIVPSWNLSYGAGKSVMFERLAHHTKADVKSKNESLKSYWLNIVQKLLWIQSPSDPEGSYCVQNYKKLFKDSGGFFNMCRAIL